MTENRSRLATGPNSLWRKALLALVVAVALVNAGARWGQLVWVAASPGKARQDPAPEWAATQLRRSITAGRQAVLVLHGLDDPEKRLGARAFEWRLRYLTYPLALRVESREPERLPEDVAAVVVYGSPARERVGWQQFRYDSVTVSIGQAHALQPNADRAAAPWPVEVGRFVVGLAALMVMGWALVGLAGLGSTPWPMRLAAAHVLGAIFLAVVVQAGWCVFGRLDSGAVYFVAAISALGVLWKSARKAGTRAMHADVAPTRTIGLLDWTAILLLVLGCVSAIMLWGARGIAWDGWVIWQMKARAFFHDGAPRILTDPAFAVSHPDYPLLVPLHSWWLFVHWGHPNEKVGQFGGLLFYGDLIAMVYGLAKLYSGRTMGLLTAGLIASQPLFVYHAISGYADLPLVLLATAGVGTLGLRAMGRLSPQAAYASAAFVAGAAQCKNEGAVLAVIVVLLWLALWLWRLVWHRLWLPSRHWVMAGILLAVLVAPWYLLRRTLAVSSDLASGRYAVVEVLPPWRRGGPPPGSVERLRPIGSAIVKQVIAVTPSPPSFGLIWLPAIIGLAAPFGNRKARLLVRSVVLLQAVAYTLVYVFTPHPIEWHLGTSLERLLMHLLPLMLLAWAWGHPSETRGVVYEDALQT